MHLEVRSRGAFHRHTDSSTTADFTPFLQTASQGASAATSPTSPLSVDFEAGLQRCMGRDDLYLQVLGRFLATSADTPAAVSASLEKSDFREALGTAHSLISNASYIGADPLSDMASRLQRACQAEDRDECVRIARDIKEEHARVVREASRHLRERTPPG